VPEIDQEALQQQMLQIQQLQQIQLMQLQLAAQQGQLVGVPPGGSGGGGGVSGGLGPLAHLGLDDDVTTGHMVRRHGVLPERLVTKDMLKQVGGHSPARWMLDEGQGVLWRAVVCCGCVQVFKLPKQKAGASKPGIPATKHAD
jgi:hypothetical protein